MQKQEGAYGARRLACVPKAARERGCGIGSGVWVEKGQIGKGPSGHTRIWPSFLKKPLKNFLDYIPHREQLRKGYQNAKQGIWQQLCLKRGE